MFAAKYLERDGENKVDLAEALLAQGARPLMLRSKFLLGLNNL